MEQTHPNDSSPQEQDKALFNGIDWFKNFFRDLLDIRNETDQDATVESIKADINFRGHTSWILICSIFIASVGLNANSTAVVIGAMLISPLMGPILGIGLSLAINDVDTLKRSVKNFAVMVGLSILTAFLFFKFFPLRDASSELLARTAPDIRDVLIAFFGGLALVIARAKKGTIASVIYGVAIATALMPPLCTVGFSLAIANFNYAAGAMYLFTINTIFIALATFLVLKVLKFPMVEYADSSKRKRLSRFVSILAVLVMIPAGYTFYKVWQKSTFNNSASQFISDTIVPYRFSEGGMFLKELSNVEYNDGHPYIELVFMGDEVIPENVINTWKHQLGNYNSLKNTELKVIQGNKDGAQQGRYIMELYESHKEELANSKSRVNVLENELERLNKLTKGSTEFEQIVKKLQINYESLSELSYANVLKSNFAKIDTVPTFMVKWKPGVGEATQQRDLRKLRKWLQLKIASDTLIVNTQ